MQSWMGMFTVLGFTSKYLFGAYLVQKFKFVCSGKNLLTRLIQICKTQWQCSLHLIQAGNTISGQAWSNKWNFFSFSRNLIHSITQIWRMQCWCSLFLFFNDPLFYSQFVWKKQNCLLKMESETQTNLILKKFMAMCSFFCFRPFCARNPLS